jgi:hypothetical protein
MTPKVEEYIKQLETFNSVQNKVDYILENQLLDRLDDLWYSMTDEDIAYIENWIKENKFD